MGPPGTARAEAKILYHSSGPVDWGKSRRSLRHQPSSKLLLAPARQPLQPPRMPLAKEHLPSKPRAGKDRKQIQNHPQSKTNWFILMATAQPNSPAPLRSFPRVSGPSQPLSTNASDTQPQWTSHCPPEEQGLFLLLSPCTGWFP
jgi:hypothetical protein